MSNDERYHSYTAVPTYVFGDRMPADTERRVGMCRREVGVPEEGEDGERKDVMK